MRELAVAADGDDGRLEKQVRGVRDSLQNLLKSLGRVVEVPETMGAPATLTRIQAILRARRQRDQIFDSELFADPAWDILLELYAAELGQYRMSVSSLCIGSAVPATTALRWIKLLEKKRLLLRTADPSDGRRVYVSLSSEAVQSMERLISSVPASEILF